MGVNIMGNESYTDRVIRSMMKENTGRHMLDSGGAYGRNWEHNQKRRKWKLANPLTVEISQYDDNLEIIPTLDLYSFLVAHLDTNDKTMYLNRMFNQYSKDSDNSWFEDISNFIDESPFIYGHGVVNTYNGESMLSQVIQYYPFTLTDEEDYYYEDEVFITLMIHGGCDVRGGYTKPVIFQCKTTIGSEPYCDWFDGQNRLSASCGKYIWVSDDCGYHYETAGNYEDEPELDLENFYVKKDKLFSKKTNEPVEFYVWW